MHPTTTVAHVLVGVESLLGVMGCALATGIVFAKFSRSTARVRFSDAVVVHEHDGRKRLQFRLANERATEVVEASVAVYLIRDEVTETGDQMRRFYPLELEREATSVFSYSFIVIHWLDETRETQP